MGLKHPVDLASWQRWQGRQHPRQAVRQRLRRSSKPTFTVLRGGPAPDLLVAIEAQHASVANAVIEPMLRLPRERVAVLLAPGISLDLPGWARDQAQDLDITGLRAVLAAGHYTELGAAAYALSRRLKVPFLVAQHGLLTPHAPPLPRDAHLLAWSRQDADFWASGRSDVRSTVVGSQLLWAAASRSGAGQVGGDRVVYLGQLHGAELPRRTLAQAAQRFCREHDAIYRPHPSERDRVSRFIHRRWQRHGVEFDTSGRQLRDLDLPVVSVFSTGVLEAAARGLPAWVDYPAPPAWLEEFWVRYEMRRYGDAPTAVPRQPAVEPAAAIARLLEDL